MLLREAFAMNESKDMNPDTVRHVNTKHGIVTSVSRGHSYTAVMHPNHRQSLRSLRDGDSSSFRDEQNNHWHATRSGDHIHLHGKKGKNAGSRIVFHRRHLEDDVKADGSYQKDVR